MSGHEDKGKRYIVLLDAARVDGSWTELPELIRKVSKHASTQKTLIQTATAEHFVATQASQRPQTALQPDGACIKSLKETVETASNPLAEEIFQSKTCLAWASWTGATKELPDSIRTADILPVFDRYGQKGTSDWTKICLAKASFIQAKAHTQRGEDAQAIAVFRAATAWVELNNDLVKSIPQLAYWAEQTVAEYAVSPSPVISVTDRLRALQSWSSLTAKRPEVPSSTYGNAATYLPRSAVWEVYHKTLSRSLRDPAPTLISRAKQASELRAVEAAYETSFLKNRTFPKATESNEPVEAWVELVFQNWQILCGPDWSDSHLGEGGRNALTRNVLDILYRAATKTFHSTLILRRLFQVHKSLAEFDLAYRCLDTYIELTERARERAAKAGEHNSESIEVTLLVVSEGIEGLCSYGGQKDAHRAWNLSQKLEGWLDQIAPEEVDLAPNGHPELLHPINAAQEVLSHETLQTVYRAIGIANANWARWTPFSEARSELQTDALEALRKATGYAEPQLPTLYALAVLCAETRDTAEALRLAKVALNRASPSDWAGKIREQSSFWHLMTLLLSSQQDFDTAAQSGAASLDSLVTQTLKLQQGSDKEYDREVQTSGADSLECDDLQRIIELQITHLAIVEFIDGPETALNNSGDLLSLYSQLFSHFEAGELKLPAEQRLPPPKSSAGTVKTVKGSIFSRRKATPSVIPSKASLVSNVPPEKPGRPGTQASQAPTIQVTDETGNARPRKHHSLLHRHHDSPGESTKRLPKANRPITAKSSNDATGRKSEDISYRAGERAAPSVESTTIAHATATNDNHDGHPGAKQELNEVVQNVTLHGKAPPPHGHTEQPLQQDVRLPNVSTNTTSTAPFPRFPKTAAQKHALVVLSKVWLTVAKLYRRSHMFEDAKEACEEAAKTASKIESLVSATEPSARALADAGWGGGGKSSDEIWADVFCAKAELLSAILRRREEEGTPATSEKHGEIVDQYEHCLMYFPNHAGGIVGLSNILFDYYEKKIELAKKVDDGRSFGIRPAAKNLHEDDILGPNTPHQEAIQDPFLAGPGSGTGSGLGSGEDLRKTPENLNRIAARDRAYGLVNTLTKLGSGWDNSEAWFALARAHELGGEVDRAKNILWWCIELEDSRPIRHWTNLGCGGYVL